MFYARTFRKDKVQFKDAYYKHRNVKQAVDSINKKLCSSRGKAARRKLAGQLHELWCAVVSLPVKNETLITQCIRWTMPVDYIAFMWQADAVPAAMAFVLLLAEMAEVDWTDDLELRRAMARAWAKFESFRKKANEIEAGYGCGEGASWFTLRDIAECPSNDRNFEAKMIDIANLAGRMLRAMGYTQKFVKNDDPHSVKGVKTGGDIARLTATELAALSSPEHEDLATMRVLTNQAQQHDPEGDEEDTRGPFVICIDESGSMDEERDFSTGKHIRGRHTWSKAAAMALVRIAWNEGRAVRIVHYASGTVVQDMPKGDHRALFEMARTFLDGGTSFAVGLREAVKTVKELEDEGHPGADIVYISDGETLGNYEHGQLNSLIDNMDRAKTELWSVAIGNDWPGDFPLRQRAKKYVHATDHRLKNLQTAADLAVGLDDAAKAVVN